MSDNVVEGFFQHSSIGHSVFEDLGPKIASYYRQSSQPPLVHTADLGYYQSNFGFDLLTVENIVRYLLTFRTTRSVFRGLEEELNSVGYHLVVQNRRKTEELLSTVWLLGISDLVRSPAFSIAVSPTTVTELTEAGCDFLPQQYTNSIPLTEDLKVLKDLYSDYRPVEPVDIGRGLVTTVTPMQPILTFWRKRSLNKLIANLVSYAESTNSISGLYYEPSVGAGIIKIRTLVPFQSISCWTEFKVPHENLDELVYQVDLTLELYPDVYEYSFDEQLKGLKDAQD